MSNIGDDLPKDYDAIVLGTGIYHFNNFVKILKT